MDQPPSPDTACMLVAGSMARISAAAEAAGLVAVAELALRRRVEGARHGLGTDESDDYTADEVGALLRMSRQTARARLALGLDLLHRRPATLAALTRGDICLTRARRISEALAQVDDDTARQVEHQALDRAPEQTPAQASARLTRLVLRADADAARRRTQAAVRDRRCSIRVLHDGTALLQVVGRTELVVAAYERIDQAARSILRDTPTGLDSGDQHAGSSVPTDPGRTLDQTRVDVVLGMLVGDPDTVTAATGVQVTVDVVAPVGTLLGGDEPGELVGYGPIPAAVRELAEDAAWRRWVTDTDGTVVARSTRRYRPSTAMVQLLRARDGTCRFPTCRRRASACDLDHVVPWPAGQTSTDNLAVLGRHHHRLKHRAGWSVRLDPDGTLHWRTPAGIDHVSPGRRLGMPEHDRPLQHAAARATSDAEAWADPLVRSAPDADVLVSTGHASSGGAIGDLGHGVRPGVPRQGPEPPGPDFPPF
ncbi:HNH endonuclease signature motif containing protein [Aquipuribacter hungaricus]